MNVYATIDDIKLYLGGGLKEHTESKDDVLLQRFCMQASRMFDKFATNGVSPMRRFYPTIATKDFDHPSDHPSDLILRDDLLEVTTLTTENGGVTILAADYMLLKPSGVYNQTPYGRIRLQPNGSTTAFSYDGTQYGSNQIEGVWGYHDSWASAWEDSGDVVLNDPLAIDGTSITVNDVDGDDINGFPKRFKYQQIIKIEDEYLWITGLDVSNETLTVRRGMNGSTAAAHVVNTPIYIFRPPDDIVEAMQVLTAFNYHRKDSVGTMGDLSFTTPQGILVMPASLPKEVQEILKPHRKEAL